MSKYIFPGMTTFVHRVVDRDGYKESHQPVALGLMVGKAETTWHLKRLADALGQLPTMLPKDRQGKIDHIYEVFGSLEISYKAADVAIREVIDAVRAENREASISLKKGK